MANYYLSENDRRLISELLEKAKTQPNRRPSPEDAPIQSPDVCIAKATESISGITIVDGDNDEVDVGTCDIYRIQDVSGTDKLIQLYSDLTHEVYNLTGSDISSGQYFTIVRDNFGKWVTVDISGYDRISGQATAAVTGSNFTIDNVTVIKGQNPLTDPTDATETVAVTNTMGWDADDDGVCFAQWNQSLAAGAGAWEAYQVECPA